MKDIRNYQQMLRDGTLSRRDFVSRMSALGVAASAVGGLVTSAEALAETPKRGGRARFGWYTHSANDTLDPAKLNSSLDYHRAYSIMSPLVRWDRELKPQPDLAESWEPQESGRVWIFELRKGVTFHNGKDLTANDVIFSIQHHMGPDSTSSIKSWLAGITDLRADGNHTVRVELEAPNADLPMYFGDMHAVIHPEGHTDYDNAIGTGPFKLESFKPGVGALVSRNENYWDEGKPYLDEIESFGIGDSAARLNALLAGDVHFILRIDPKTANLIQQSPGVEFEPTKTARHVTFPMMADRPPFENLDLRLAMKYLAHRQSMLTTVQQGHGSIANDVALGPMDPYYCKELAQREYDLERAKHHLKKAGYESGFSIDLHTSEAAAGPSSPDLALHLAETAAPAGVKINVVKHPADGYWSAVWLKKTFCMSNWFARPTADLRFSTTNLSGASGNEGFYKDERVDNLILEARATLDGPRRYELYCELQKILHDADGRIIPLFIDFLDARRSDLKGYQPHPFSEAAGCRLADEVWLG